MRSLVACLVLAGGCGAVQDVIGTDKPRARVVGVAIEDFSLDGLALRFDVRIDNPYGAGLPLLALDYALESDGRKLLAGKAAEAGTVPAKGSLTVPVTAGLRFADVLQTLTDVRPGALVPYTAAITVSVDVPAVGKLALPVRKQGTIPVPAVPDVSVVRIEWSRLELTEARAVMRLAGENPNRFAIDLSRLGFALSLGRTEVARAVVAKGTKLSAGGKDTLEVAISMSPIDLGVSVFHVLRGSDARYRLEGTVDVGTPYGALAMPYESSGRVPFFNR